GRVQVEHLVRRYAVLTRRSTVAAVALTLGILATPAAGKAPVCNLVRDPAGDDSVGLGSVDGPPTDTSDTLDILSADLATDRATLTVVIRVAKLSFYDPTAPTGQRYSFWFLGDESRFLLEAHRTRTGEFFTAQVQGPPTAVNGTDVYPMYPLGPVRGMFDDDANEVRIHVRIADLQTHAPTLRTGESKLTGLRIRTYRNVEEAGGSTGKTGLLTDRADGGRTGYRQDAASCVRVGR
ncbi:MAG TPA: hypothetical protein VNA12_07835, partial [Mycobacteriales bacterium]|nr:hypothetical protein [Mycobacteriales bacterium]